MTLTGEPQRETIAGPLAGLQVLLMPSIGPGPMAAHYLAGLGANVIRVDWIADAHERDGVPDLRERQTPGSASIALNLRSPAAVEIARELADRSDVVIDGFRPGAAGRLGFESARLLESNPRLIVAEVTGWGQEGPYAGLAGHDINYIGLVGALAAIGPRGGPPTPPLHYVGIGATAMTLAAGILAALVERAASGRGQILDASFVDSVGWLSSMIFDLEELGDWRPALGANRIDGGAPYYAVYQTADGGYMAVGAVEEHFYLRLLATLGLDAASLPSREDRTNWPSLLETIAERFRSRTRDQWTAAFRDVDACVTPVLTYGEAATEPHLAARGAIGPTGVPVPSPRFSRTPAPRCDPPATRTGQHTVAVLDQLGLSEERIQTLAAEGVIELLDRSPP